MSWEEDDGWRDENDYCDEFDSLAPIPRVIERVKRYGLKSVHLSNYVVQDPSELKPLMTFLATDDRVESLTFYEFRVGGEAAQDLMEMLKQNTHLQTLNISACEFGEAGGRALAEGIKFSRSLTYLILDEEFNTRSYGEHFGTYLVDALANNTVLQGIDLNGRVGDETACHFAEGLKTNKSITRFEFRSKAVGEVGAGGFGDALTVNDTLRTLKLNCEPGEEGTAKVLRALAYNTSLRTLFFRNVLAKGLTCLPNVFQSNNTLTELQLLAYNDDGSLRGTGELFRAVLASTTSLELISLASKLGPSDGIAIAEGLKQNKTVVYLFLEGNELGDEGGVALGDACRVHEKIREAHLSLNGFSLQVENYLYECLRGKLY